MVKVEFRDRRLINPALQRKEVVDQFLAYNPWAKEAVGSCYKRILSVSYDRALLSKLLLDYNEKINHDSSSLENCKRIQQQDTTMIVTGQQAGMFTGPLYTIYKIITTINLAKHYTDCLGTAVIPLFWNATEDHDLSEIATFNYPNKTWRADFANAGMAAECLETAPAVRALIKEYLSTVSEVNHHQELKALLSNPFGNYGEFSSNIIANLFQGTGLVILEPRILRTRCQGFFRRCLDASKSIRERLEIAGSELKKYDITPSFEMAADITGLFYINRAGKRNRILTRNGKWLVDKKWVGQAEVLHLIDDDTDRFSTRAFMRPILQSLYLPNIAYVAGPGEYTYHLQLKSIYDLFGAVMPVIFLRNHATILTKREEKLARRLNLTTDDFFKKPDTFYNSVKLPEKYQMGFLQVRNRLEDLAGDVVQMVPDLVSPERAETLKAAWVYQLEKLKKKCEKDYSRQCKVDNARVDRFFNCVRPKNLPQERVLNILYFIEANGMEFIKELMDSLDPFETRHYILTTTH